jgi:hypothetical protein
MEGKKPMKLQNVLLFWNVFLAAFSILGTFKVSTVMSQGLWDLGVYETVCHAG